MDEVEEGEVIGRVRIADRWLKRFRDADIAASNQYIDSNGSSMGYDDGWDDGMGQTFRTEADTPAVVPIGQPNYMAINVEVGAAAVASQLPKLHVKAIEQQPEQGKTALNIPSVIQGAWDQSWNNGDFNGEMRAAWQKRKICGLGCIWYRWDENYGFVIENVTSNRFFFDPHARNLKRLRYGGVIVYMPMSEAIRKYDPNGENEYFTSEQTEFGNPVDTVSAEQAERETRDRLTGYHDDQLGASNERQTVKIFVYFDLQQEVHIYNDQVIHKTENLYGKVPLLFKRLFDDPRDRILPLGMNVFARGLNQEIVWLAGIASSTAKNGGPITLYDTNIINGETETALQKGSTEQMLGVKPLNMQKPPIVRIPGSPLPEGFNVALTEAKAAMGGIMGVSDGMRGQVSPGTATAAMLSESKSNAMQIDDQVKFEGWVSEVATCWVECTQKFGGPVSGKPNPEKAKILWHAFCAVLSVSVVSGSTSFSNPATELQATMQLFTTITQAWELFMGLAAKGIIDEVPNIKTVFNDLLIAFNRSNIDEYWQKAPPPPQGASTLPPDLVKWMQGNYDGAPEDIKRQMEQMLGFKPSQMPPEQEAPDNSAGIAALQAHMEQMKMAQQAKEKEQDHIHDARMKTLDTASQIAVNNAKAAVAPKETPQNGSASRKNEK